MSEVDNAYHSLMVQLEGLLTEAEIAHNIFIQRIKELRNAQRAVYEAQYQASQRANAEMLARWDEMDRQAASLGESPS